MDNTSDNRANDSDDTKASLAMRQIAQEIQNGADYTWDDVRQRLNQAACEEHVWAGVPLPVSGLRLVIEDRYPYRGLQTVLRQNIENKPAQDQDQEAAAQAAQSLSQLLDSKIVIHNQWFDSERQRWICLYRDQGKAYCYILPRSDVGSIMSTLEVASSPAWSIEAEERAMAKLRTLIGEHCYKIYLTTGMFLERSPRSGVHYLFRRLRPTIAIGFDEQKQGRAFCALCLHPIGYYVGSWCGAHVPTDDVIAHLILMRGDEHRFWKISGQHPMHYPAAGWIAGAA